MSLGQPEGDSSLALSPALQPGGGSKLADLPGAPPPGAGPYEFDPALLYTPASDGDSVTFLSDEPWHEHSTDLRAEDSLVRPSCLTAPQKGLSHCALDKRGREAPA